MTPQPPERISFLWLKTLHIRMFAVYSMKKLCANSTKIFYDVSVVVIIYWCEEALVS